jgi:hypothetical protein
VRARESGSQGVPDSLPPTSCILIRTHADRPLRSVRRTRPGGDGRRASRLRSRHFGRSVAIKVIRSSQFATTEEQADASMRFRREAAAAGRLSHPGNHHRLSIRRRPGPWVHRDGVRPRLLARSSACERQFAQVFLQHFATWRHYTFERNAPRPPAELKCTSLVGGIGAQPPQAPTPSRELE